MEASPRLRGRPPGVRNGEGKTSLAPIKKWTTKHDMVVYLHSCNMMGNKEIALRMGCTETRVSQILNDPQAQSMIRKIQISMREKLQEDTESQLLGMNVQAVKNIKQTLEMSLDLINTPQAKIHQDNVSMNLLKGTGILDKLEVDERNKRASVGPKLNDSLATKLLYALEKSNEVEEIRRGISGQKVVEADAIIEEEGEEKV